VGWAWCSWAGPGTSLLGLVLCWPVLICMLVTWQLVESWLRGVGGDMGVMGCCEDAVRVWVGDG
jgi:hypothetical protein